MLHITILSTLHGLFFAPALRPRVDYSLNSYTAVACRGCVRGLCGGLGRYPPSSSVGALCALAESATSSDIGIPIKSLLGV